MTQPGWSARLVKVIAGEVKRHRVARVLSAQQLADRCAQLGHAMPRSVLANLESGRRETITVPELLVLAQALEVPPTDLLLPLGHADRVEILPGVEVTPGDALHWVSGHQPLPGLLWKGGVSVAFYNHRSHVEQWRIEQLAARKLREQGHEDMAQQHERYAAREREVIWALRKRMREQGLTPPELPAELAAVEEVEQA